MKHHHVSFVSFLMPLALGALTWWQLSEPDHWAGLGIAAGVFVLVWPLIALFFWSLPCLLVGLVTTPHERAAYRKRRKDAGKGRSAPIRAWVRRAAFRADRYRCVYCHVKIKGQTGLEADHFWPYAGGGQSHIFNIFALCRFHNEVKSNYWVDPDGYVHYRPWGYNDRKMAAEILAAERRHRRNPVRWMRAAWSLAW